ncbi:MAG: hypothetical protein BEN19_03435 [Epulopiscium sp. Nuni2H_MBin003]|nr:MAG: hypothetical protein BEN19_03435 [Epulopiscium sp. Nuni2H_MBin003]
MHSLFNTTILLSLGAAVASNITTEQVTQTPDLVVVNAEVAAIDRGLLVIGLDENFSGLCNVNTTNIILDDDLTVGDTIEITFDGNIMESWPAQIGKVDSIVITHQGSDTLNVYREAFYDLRYTDIDLDRQAELIAVDLTEVTNLNDSQKQALLYLVSCDIDLFDKIYESTFTELEQQGFIKNEEVEDTFFTYFENGVIYTLKNHQEDVHNFSFDIEKWTSSLGAIGFSECTATLKDDIYIWTIGETWAY